MSPGASHQKVIFECPVRSLPESGSAVYASYDPAAVQRSGVRSRSDKGFRSTCGISVLLSVGSVGAVLGLHSRQSRKPFHYVGHNVGGGSELSRRPPNPADAPPLSGTASPHHCERVRRAHLRRSTSTGMPYWAVVLHRCG